MSPAGVYPFLAVWQRRRGGVHLLGGLDPVAARLSSAGTAARSEALTRSRQLAQPFSLAFALTWAAWLHQLRREPHPTQVQAEAAIAVCTEQGFAQLLAFGRLLRGWALAMQAQGDEGLADIHQGLAAYQATGAAVGRPQYLALLAEAQGQLGQPQGGWRCSRKRSRW